MFFISMVKKFTGKYISQLVRYGQINIASTQNQRPRVYKYHSFHSISCDRLFHHMSQMWGSFDPRTSCYV